MLLRPVLFADGKCLDFRVLRRPNVRRERVRSFYSTLRKSPREVFPLHFRANSETCSGVNSGKLDGFFSFPLDSEFEIDTGETLLTEPLP